MTLTWDQTHNIPRGMYRGAPFGIRGYLVRYVPVLSPGPMSAGKTQEILDAAGLIEAAADPFGQIQILLFHDLTTRDFLCPALLDIGATVPKSFRRWNTGRMPRLPRLVK
jgi:hypothetical protein